jgi:ketosteroid isomerase-like protein
MVPSCTAPVADQVREIYRSLGSQDLDRIASSCHPDVTVQVAGSHPLSGTHVGAAAVRELFERIQDGGGPGKFTITTLMADDDEVLVEACVAHAGYVRTIVHRLVLRDGRLASLREHPMDQVSEDAFWKARLD